MFLVAGFVNLAVYFVKDFRASELRVFVILHIARTKLCNFEIHLMKLNSAYVMSLLVHYKVCCYWYVSQFAIMPQLYIRLQILLLLLH